MDYEKLYKEALERAKIWQEHLYEISDKDYADELNYIFPELKESEDERIRKELITHCRNTRCVTEEGAERIAKWIAWLEKQGEKATDEMIEALRTEYEKGRADAITEMQGNQKPAWSEEDEEMFGGIIADIQFRKKTHNHEVIPVVYEREIDWLKSLKERMKGEWVMEAPEKIYVKITHPISDEYTEMVAFEHGDGVEYTRTDAFIDKAADKFKQLMYDQHFFEGMVYQDAIIENLVGYFKTYMKGE